MVPNGAASAADLFAAHMQAELNADLEATMATMVAEPHLLLAEAGAQGDEILRADPGNVTFVPERICMARRRLLSVPGSNNGICMNILPNGKLVIIGIVALIAIGPKELPTVLRTLGQWMGKIKRMAAEFQGQFQEAMREAEMADLKKSVDEMTDMACSIVEQLVASGKIPREAAKNHRHSHLLLNALAFSYALIEESIVDSGNPP